ncbi:outer membrane lipoprotein [Salmonella enterica subsp. enterica]|nr:outer membrane lipoprotein [Salmonella enterica subsp. enterica]
MKAFSPLAVLISALLLQGCVAAAVVGYGSRRHQSRNRPA